MEKNKGVALPPLESTVKKKKPDNLPPPAVIQTKEPEVIDINAIEKKAPPATSVKKAAKFKNE